MFFEIFWFRSIKNRRNFLLVHFDTFWCDYQAQIFDFFGRKIRIYRYPVVNQFLKISGIPTGRVSRVFFFRFAINENVVNVRKTKNI